MKGVEVPGRPGFRAGLRKEAGYGVVLALMLTGLLSALGLGLVLNLSIERWLAANFHEAAGLRQAAESALEVGLHELGPYDTWSDALAGLRVARFADGAPAGQRTIADGGSVDLDRLTAVATCGRFPCAETDIVTPTASRPWGAANPRWRLFAWGPASAMADAAWVGDPYLLVWVADDPLDADGDPWRDAPEGVSGHGRLLLRAQAHGRRGAQVTVEAVVRHACATEAPGPCIEGIRVQSWRVVD